MLKVPAKLLVYILYCWQALNLRSLLPREQRVLFLTLLINTWLWIINIIVLPLASLVV